MHRIVSIEAGALKAQLRRPAFAHTWIEHEATAQHEVAERLADATIAIVNKRRLSAAIIAGLPALQMVAIAATGYNNVDLDACRARGIVVSNVRGYARETVPEHVFALLLALARQIGPFHRSVAAGRWQKSEQFCYFDYPIRDLAGQTLGLLGSGTLGQGVARIAAAFGMRVVLGEHKSAATCRDGYLPFERLIREADVISLDVLTEEPPVTNPLLAPDLLDAGNFILTPHVAWSSREAMQTLADQLIDNIEAFVAGAAVNRVA